MDVSKTVVITGSTKGFGKELAKEFLNRGHNVVVCSKSASNVEMLALELKHHDNCLALVADVQDYSSCKELHYQTIKRFDSVDILVNNAATNTNQRQDFLCFDDEEIKMMVDTNLLGTMYCSKVFLPGMLKRKNGTIINVEGTGSKRFGETKGYSIYASTKSGVTRFTDTLRKEYKNESVHFCTLSPGMMHTDILWTKNASEDMRRAFNMFGEYPEIVARYMVDEILRVNKNSDLEYLTWCKIIEKMIAHALFNKENYM